MKSRLGLGLVEGVEVLAEGGDDGLVAVGVAAEDVLWEERRVNGKKRRR